MSACTTWTSPRSTGESIAPVRVRSASATMRYASMSAARKRLALIRRSSPRLVSVAKLMEPRTSAVPEPERATTRLMSTRLSAIAASTSTPRSWMPMAGRLRMPSRMVALPESSGFAISPPTWTLPSSRPSSRSMVSRSRNGMSQLMEKFSERMSMSTSPSAGPSAARTPTAPRPSAVSRRTSRMSSGMDPSAVRLLPSSCVSTASSIRRRSAYSSERSIVPTYSPSLRRSASSRPLRRGLAGAGEIHKPLYGAAEAFESEQIGDGVEPEALKRKDEVLFAGWVDDAVDGELLLVGVQQQIADPDGLAERDGGFLEEHPLVAIESEVEAFENDLSALRIEICRPVDAQIPAAVEHGIDGKPQRVAIERGFVGAALHTCIGDDEVIQLAA